MEIYANIGVNRQFGYKKRKLSEVNPGKSGGQTGFLPGLDKVAA
jgi:hypothetical protein